MPAGLARKLLILFIGVLLILIGFLYQIKQNTVEKPKNKPHTQDISTVLMSSLQQQRRYFQRCWLKSPPTVNSNESLNELTWQIFLKIEPSGKVNDFSLINKGLFDTETEKCLKEISYRLKFPAFEGETISITVPIVISNLSENH